MSHTERDVEALADILAIIQRHQVCRLAINDDVAPYIVPVNYGYECEDGRWFIYFHGARTGKKMRLLRRNPAVSVEIDGDHGLITADEACDHSYAFTSIIASGRADILREREAMQHGLDVIMRQVRPGERFSYQEKMMKAVCVVRIACDSLTCRRHPAP
ncbi:pyridoxamine 5'-phosphate oxidase family protein [Trabulsiella odontotermitis]|uniref:pyridoxamine 5'-phosphate oxidase family protein n=1 Tax=Trabulsiella odontotermitis TaxID=379893 RepID=UPI00067689EF|nr:pyridoxamine 5'-phosphate oxidase family protein [Trabulsiella odontotermitis]KNC91771.1 5-nitroimidazole antibiotic resistance protein [Trabulsiella odontotermitis]